MQNETAEAIDKLAEEIGLHTILADRKKANPLRNALSFLIDFAGEDRNISSKHLTALRKKHPEITRGSMPNYLSIVLTALNRHGWQCVIPPKPVKPPRPVALPDTSQLAKASHEVMRLEQLLRREGTLHTRVPVGRLFLAALYFVTRCGAGDQVVCGILSRLRIMDIDDSEAMAGRIRTPIHGAAEYGLDYELIPPEPLRSLLVRQKKRMKSHDPQTLVFADALNNCSNGAVVSDIDLRRALQGYLKNIRHSQGAQDHLIELPKTWGGITRAGRWLARSFGVPPAILEILSAYPLPKSALGLELFNDPKVLGNGIIRIPPSSPLFLNTTNQTSKQPVEAPVLMPQQPPSDWGAWARNTLRAFLLAVETDCCNQKNGRIKPSATRKLSEILGLYLDQADQGAPSQRSVIHLGLHWLTLRLGKREITVSSARTYLWRIFQPRLLDKTESVDMASWDEETIDELTTYLMLNPRWSAKSQKDFLETWMQFLRFCAQEDVGVLSRDDINPITEDPTEGVLRGRRKIIMPYQFDHVLNALSQDTELTVEEKFQHKAILILGFYGGLRSSEVLNLKLADAVSTLDEFFFNIHHSKTPAGRRAIPLHRILPTMDSLEPLRQWVVKRQEEANHQYQKASLDSLPLFGKLIQNHNPQWEEVIKPAIDFLRRKLCINIDFHGLRHSAASWLVLRSYAAYHPDICTMLRHGNHPCFQEPSQKKLRQFFKVYEPATSDGQEKILVHIAKFLGHANLRSLMQTYGHTLGPIHSHALNAASTIDTHAKRVHISKKS